MRANLAGGKLIPPRTVAEGEARLVQIRRAIAEIEAALADHLRPLHLDNRRRAQGNLGWLKSEERQLAAWLKANQPAEADFDAFWNEP